MLDGIGFSQWFLSLRSVASGQEKPLLTGYFWTESMFSRKKKNSSSCYVLHKTSQKGITRRNCAVTARKSNKVRYARGVCYSDKVTDELLFLNFSSPSPSLLDFIFNGCHRTGAR